MVAMIGLNKRELRMGSVDVAIPCYQYGRYLRECVTSVLSQDVQELRVLIIDNASKDGSVEVARQLAAEDSRVEVSMHEANLGIHASFNEGIDWVCADYFMILAADDFLTPGALSRAVSILDGNPEASFAVGREEQMWEGEPSKENYSRCAINEWKLRPGRSFIEERCRLPSDYHAGFLLVRTRAQKCAGHYRPRLPHSDDLEMLLRLSLQGAVAETEAIQGIRREHNTNRSRDYRANGRTDAQHRLDAFESFFLREGAKLPNADRLRNVARRSVAEWAYWSSLSHIIRGHIEATVELMTLAINLRPIIALVPPVNYLFRMDKPLARIGAVLSGVTNYRLRSTIKAFGAIPLGIKFSKRKLCAKNSHKRFASEK